MRVLLLGQPPDSLRELIARSGFQPVADRPEAIVCYGGDGTLLGSERDYPGVPKIPIRKRLIEDGRLEDIAAVLRHVAEGRFTRTRLGKLEAACDGVRLLALNDVIVRNAVITSAVRYRVVIDGVEHAGEIVGDGLVASTPFGSSAYYRSITNSVIHVGIGLAFNNSTEPVNHLVLGEHSRIEIRITRGPAILAADNNPEFITLTEGAVIRIALAPEQAEIWEIENLLIMGREYDESGRRMRWMHPLTRPPKTPLTG